jgi:outer membrane protein assembly factor BamD (BamD/ComL family)
MINKFPVFCLLASIFYFGTVQAQESQLQSIEDVISGIDSLLQEIDGATSPVVSESPLPTAENRPFRVEDELMPKELIKEIEPTAVALEEQPVSRPQSSPTGNQPLVQPGRTTDFSKLSLSELLNEVDMLQSPAPGVSGGIVEPLPVTNQARPDAETSSLLIQSKELSQSPNFVPTALQPSSDAIDEPEKAQEVFIDDYIVLGDSIDQEMKEKIRECILSTRMASGGTNTPFVTRSVFKATSYCNRVLGRLNAPNHKRYRRDILLSMINMHERNQAWVDAAKTYERFLEEFAANDNYPFEQHEDAPGIPDLSAPLGSVRKLLEGFKRGAPTIPETHIRLGKIYRQLGADRMALNKFYDAINATLTLPYNESFTDAEKRKGQSFESRKDAESNRAMLEIAETFLSGENYDSAIKFYDRLNRLEQLDDKERSIVQYKRGLAHFRRAVATLKQEESMSRTKEGVQAISQEPEFDKTARADFAKVKEILRGYSTLFPESSYVPETHYILALAYEQLNQDEESISQLLSLLREADFNPSADVADEQLKTDRDRDYAKIDQLKIIWSFWKKKTGNYLANKFFEAGEYFNAYRIYSALRPIDDDPNWQVPLLYQIALCEEKLGNYVQASESYLEIEDYVNQVKEAREGLAESNYLNFVFGMAKWRREQLEDTREIRQAVNRFGIYSMPRNNDNVTESF